MFCCCCWLNPEKLRTQLINLANFTFLGFDVIFVRLQHLIFHMHIRMQYIDLSSHAQLLVQINPNMEFFRRQTYYVHPAFLLANKMPLVNDNDKRKVHKQNTRTPPLKPAGETEQDTRSSADVCGRLYKQHNHHHQGIKADVL